MIFLMIRMQVFKELILTLISFQKVHPAGFEPRFLSFRGNIRSHSTTGVSVNRLTNKILQVFFATCFIQNATSSITFLYGQAQMLIKETVSTWVTKNFNKGR